MLLRHRGLIVIFLLITLIFSVQSGINIRAESQPSTGRSVTIPIKVVLLGFEQSQIILTDFKMGSFGSPLPLSISSLLFDSGNNTGVVFRPDYKFSFASSNFKNDFEKYLNSIAQTKVGNNPWFVRYAPNPQNPEYFDQNPVAVKYVVYDAESVENWLWNHSADFGGTVANGWTIIISYLPDLPSISFSDVHDFLYTNGEAPLTTMPHYYGVSVTDLDLGYQFRYRDFMNAYGGHHRMWFLDLSAGPVWNSQWEDLPLQVVLGDNKIDLASDFGRHWLTDYIGDYVAQATYNFIAQSFLYYPQYAKTYQIDVFILDDRNQTEKALIPISRTVNKELIQSAFRDLIPYSEVIVNLSFPAIPPELEGVIKSNYKYTDSWIEGAMFASPQWYGVVNIKPVYNYILSHLTQFESQPFFAGDKMTIPVFAFAFSGRTYFTDTYKWYIGKTDWENGALLGEALPECVMISYNQWSFTRGNQVIPQQPGKGEGLTETIIHEVGHEFGLMHPHQYGNVGDFIASAMGYFTNDYTFFQMDKDSLQRAHVDQLYIATEQLLTQLQEANPGLLREAKAKLTEANEAYAQMNYAAAIQPVLTAYQLVQKAKNQYQLAITSAFGSSTGAGWYDAGSTTTFSITPSTIDQGNGTRLLFAGWKGDSTATTPSASIVITGAKAVTATWKKQYCLTVNSAYGSPTGSGWYNQDSSATFSVPTSYPVEGLLGALGGKYVFQTWSGDATSTTPTATVKMNAPKTVTAIWTTDVTMPLIIIGIILLGVAVGIIKIRKGLAKKLTPPPSS